MTVAATAAAAVAPGSQCDAAATLLPPLRAAFDRATQALAQRCAGAGGLNADALDAQQLPCFELAWTRADLLAAETVLLDITNKSSELDTHLALIFSAEAIAAVLARLEGLHLHLGLDLAPLQALHSDPAWAAMRREANSSAVLGHVGKALARGGVEIGTVELDEPHQMAQQAFRRFGEEVVAPQAAAIHRDNLTVPESLLQPLREMGVFGLAIPERYGGSAPNDRDDTLMMVVVTEALSEASLAAAGSLITRPEILSRALLQGGSEAQKALWLPQIASGSPLCAISITEPDHGSDVANLTLKATPTAGGWLLNGAKTWCTFAGKAGLLMVVARTHSDKALGHRGLSLMLVEKPSHDGHAFDFVQPGRDAANAPSHAGTAQTAGGRLRGQAIHTIGYRGMHSFELSFEDFFVPDDRVIGEQAGLGKGFYFTMAGMVGGRMQTAARATGVMRAALRAAVQYAGDRRVFGAPLIDYPLTLAKLARMAARLAACRQLAYAVARQLDAGGDRSQASLVKLLACRSAEMVTREALQIHGGMGYAEESAVSRYFVDARVLSIFEGAEETLALKVIARNLLENALENAA